MPEGPDGLLDARTLMSNTLKEAQNDKLTPAQLFIAYKLAEFPPTFHRIFEVRHINQNVYKPNLKGPLHNTTYDMWIKAVLNIGGSHTHTIARLWSRAGELTMTAVQEGVARAPLKK
ncbi:unnamed protein product [Cylicocyclus nassatus]|uniref:Uncharacterized protein n=1 Tax=Cylicocyclus nassatus TaxID=53992 RepID=A0AA36MGK2_CYLNA|nr:unnamed protein product [Cylicocyclus nassatus]